MPMAPKKRTAIILAGIVLPWLAVPMVLMTERNWGESDVGELVELSGIQSKLTAKNICEANYATRDNRGHRTHYDGLFLTPCIGREFETVLLQSTAPFTQKGSGFRLRRDNMSDRFRVWVEKDEVPFPD
jgi:hypothetical protein